MYDFIWKSSNIAVGLVNTSNSSVKDVYERHDLAQQEKYDNDNPDLVDEDNYLYGGNCFHKWPGEYGSMDEQIWEEYKQKFLGIMGQVNASVRGIVFANLALVKQNVVPQPTEAATVSEAFGGGPLGNSFSKLVDAWCQDRSVKGRTPKHFMNLLIDSNKIIDGELRPDEYPIKPEYGLNGTEVKVCKDYLNFFAELNKVNWSKGLKANGEEFMEKYKIDFILV